MHRSVFVYLPRRSFSLPVTGRTLPAGVQCFHMEVVHLVYTIQQNIADLLIKGLGSIHTCDFLGLNYSHNNGLALYQVSAFTPVILPAIVHAQKSHV